MPSATAHGQGSDIPADGVEFELTLTTIPDPMEMVRGDGYNPDDGWKYNGNGVTPRTGRFKMVRTGYDPNLDGVLQKLVKDNIPEGQWREAFKKKYPKNDGQGPIGVADLSWKDSRDRDCIPVLTEYRGEWNSSFELASILSHQDWRWLMACP